MSAQKNIVIIGASGAIGHAMAHIFANNASHQVFAFSRSVTTDLHQNNITTGHLDFRQESSIQSAAALISAQGGADIVIIATGFLHQEASPNEKSIQPEKSIRRIDQQAMEQVMFVNTIGPALVLKHFVPIMPKNKPYIIGALSARVGSIADNKLGGWYAYRAAKTALNMILKTASIEASRANEQSIIVGLHPGTVESNLSKPFKANVPKEQLLTPLYAAEQLVKVVHSLNSAQTGRVFAWDGQQIEY